jgi:capsular polysaccharide biosynthesis protein
MRLAIFGILISFLGGVITAFGWAFQKKAFKNRLRMDSEMKSIGQEVSGSV